MTTPPTGPTGNGQLVWQQKQAFFAATPTEVPPATDMFHSIRNTPAQHPRVMDSGKIRRKKLNECKQEGCYKKIDVVFQGFVCKHCHKDYCNSHRQYEKHACISREELQRILIEADLKKLEKQQEKTFKSHHNKPESNGAR